MNKKENYVKLKIEIRKNKIKKFSILILTICESDWLRTRNKKKLLELVVMIMVVVNIIMSNNEHCDFIKNSNII